jgi:hypothetical protein
VASLFPRHSSDAVTWSPYLYPLLPPVFGRSPIFLLPQQGDPPQERDVPASREARAAGVQRCFQKLRPVQLVGQTMLTHCGVSVWCRPDEFGLGL